MSDIISNPVNIAVFVSGGGTNLQSLIDAQKNGILVHGLIKLVISNNANAYALTRATENGIATAVITRKLFASQEEYEDAIIDQLRKYKIKMIILAGFMSILSQYFTSKFADRIINIHPSLIPSFCGKGYYGLKVHEAALNYGVKVTGATVHYVNEVPDGGKIIMQKAVEIEDDDTPEILQKRVMQQAEWKILPIAADKTAKIISEQGE